MKRLLRWAVGGAWAPQYEAIAPGPATVRATLNAGARRWDVTAGCSVASLHPLRLALVLPEAVESATLSFHDAATGVLLGELGLVHQRDLQLGLTLRLFAVTWARNHCASRRVLELHGLRHRVQALRQPGPRRAFTLDWAALQPVLVFYTQPRPVHIVSVERPGGEVLFPMDLIGELPEGRVLLALRSTNAHLPFMARPGHLVLSSVPLALKDVAYGLARFHQQAADAAALAFPTQRSPRWGLKVPAQALRLREVSCLETAVVGSHHLFVCRVEQETPLAEGAPLCHVQGFYSRRPRS